MEDLERAIDLCGRQYFELFLTRRKELQTLSRKDQFSRFLGQSTSRQTAFYREREVFRALHDIVLPSFKQSTVHVASVACSTGKESYTILLDNWDQYKRLKIDGYDISRENIAQARKGKYFLGIGSADYTRLKISQPNVFEEALQLKDGSAILHQRARDRTHFYTQNLLTNPLQRKYHVIVALNFLYHFNKNAREVLLSHITKGLFNQGWLLCEHNPSTLGRNEYCDWMQDLERFSLERQVLQVPFFNDDGNPSVTNRVLAYKKKDKK